ncbi:MAG: histidine--tRNA ligase [Actinomycetota bacterium]
MELSPPRGTADLFPPRSEQMLALERSAHELARVHGYRYVQTPAFEHTELFARTSGESSDIVTKEMYTFEDKGGRSLTLRPEGTAPVMRAYLEHQQDLPLPFKAYYVGSFWRHGRPQAGRLREFRQLGIEVIGTDAPGADVETILVADRFLRGHGLATTTLKVNSIGDPSCRSAYRDVLVAYLRDHEDALCKDCRARIDTNPLRTFDCKEEGCRSVMADAPVIADHLCDACAEHFTAVQEGLAIEEVPFEIDRRLVRGLDYYTRTAFEFVSEALPAAQATLCGGGRYDGLAEELGGRPTPGIGFGLGLERVLLALENEQLGIATTGSPACFVVGIGDEAPVLVRNLVRTLRRMGVASEAAFEERPLKAQLKMADRAGARFAAIIGDREAEERVVTIKDLRDGSQSEVPLGEVGPWISSRA